MKPLMRRTCNSEINILCVRIQTILRPCRIISPSLFNSSFWQFLRIFSTFYDNPSRTVQ